MRVGLSGSSSTGKTTLLRALSERSVLAQFGLELLFENEREVLDELGFRDTGAMASSELREFQRVLLDRKISREKGKTAFICEHSFVSMAAYWTIRDSVEEVEGSPGLADPVLALCRDGAALYDIHIVLPFGAVPFEEDGYRSRDMSLHERVAERIDHFHQAWEVNYVVLQSARLEERVEEVREALAKEKARLARKAQAKPAGG